MGGSIYRKILMNFGEIYSKNTMKRVHFASTQKCLYKCKSHGGKNSLTRLIKQNAKHTQKMPQIHNVRGSSTGNEMQKCWTLSRYILYMNSFHNLQKYSPCDSIILSVKIYIFTLRQAETISLSTAPDLNTHPYRVHHPSGQLGLATENSIDDFGLFTWRTQYMCLMTPTKFTSSLSH